MRQIAFFDLDHTITSKDTFIEFLKFTHGKFRFYLNIICLSPILVLYKVKLIPNWKAKIILLSFFYKRWTAEKLLSLGRSFALQQLPIMVYDQALAKIKWHLNEGHKVVIVSASINIWFESWCKQYDLELLSTELAFVDGVFVGTYDRPNCYGIEKVKRIKEKYDLSQYDKIYAYGDSKADQFMMGLAHESFMKPFS